MYKTKFQISAVVLGFCATLAPSDGKSFVVGPPPLAVVQEMMDGARKTLNAKQKLESPLSVVGAKDRQWKISEAYVRDALWIKPDVIAETITMSGPGAAKDTHTGGYMEFPFTWTRTGVNDTRSTGVIWFRSECPAGTNCQPTSEGGKSYLCEKK